MPAKGRANLAPGPFGRIGSHEINFLQDMRPGELLDIKGIVEIGQDLYVGGDVFFQGDIQLGDAVVDTITFKGKSYFEAEASNTQTDIDTTGVYVSGWKSRLTSSTGDGSGALRGASCRAEAGSGSDDVEIYGGEFYATVAAGGRVRDNVYGVLGYTKIQNTVNLPTNYVQGVLGIYECTGSDPATAKIKGAVVGTVKWDANAIPDGAFVAFRDGGGAGTAQGAAYKAKQLASDTIPAFKYGLDLYTENDIGAGYSIADIRLQSKITIVGGTGAPTLSLPQGSLYLRTDGTTTNDRAYIATDAVGGWTALTTAS